MSLPFLVPPKQQTEVLGDDQIGKIEVLKYGALTQPEQDFIENAEVEQTYKLAIRMARDIADKNGSTVLEVANALLGGNYDFFRDDLEDIFAFNDKRARIQREIELLLATAIIKHRLVSEWTIDHTADHQRIPPALMRQVAEFAVRERDGDKPQDSGSDGDDERIERIVNRLLDTKTKLSTLAEKVEAIVPDQPQPLDQPTTVPSPPAPFDGASANLPPVQQ